MGYTIDDYRCQVSVLTAEAGAVKGGRRTGMIKKILLFLTILCLGLSAYLFTRTAAVVKETDALREEANTLQERYQENEKQLQDLQQQLTDIETANAGALREYRIWEHEIEKIEPYLR